MATRILLVSCLNGNKLINLPIETERLIIRRFKEEDLDGFLCFMLNEESTKYLVFKPEQKTESGAKALFDNVVNAYDTQDAVHGHAIVDKAAGEYVGSCGFMTYEDGIVECYYSINAEHCGKGFATEATKALVEALSETFEVRAYCHSENLAAHAVARKCGMEHRGVARNKNTGLEYELFVRPVS